jgi:hypothetical protein
MPLVFEPHQCDSVFLDVAISSPQMAGLLDANWYLERLVSSPIILHVRHHAHGQFAYFQSQKVSLLCRDLG